MRLTKHSRINELMNMLTTIVNSVGGGWAKLTTHKLYLRLVIEIEELDNSSIV